MFLLIAIDALDAWCSTSSYLAFDAPRFALLRVESVRRARLLVRIRMITIVMNTIMHTIKLMASIPADAVAPALLTSTLTAECI